MLARLFRRQSRPDTAPLYGAILAAARRPSLYQDCGVPDTVEGRFETLVLHMAVVLRRLAAIGAPARELGEDLIATFFAEMDSSLREMGVGDLSVPKRMKRLASAFYGRAQVYETALAAGDQPALADAIARNVLAGGPGDAAAIAADALAWARQLDQLDLPAFVTGAVRPERPSEGGRP